ncbi:MAG: diaminopimelate decarboxylase [Candidatus Omnitrophica bacterium]|nr:diaminopimelate decarboxylase [Candidatus Omnitrophota bacterium]
MRDFQFKKNRLLCEGVDLEKIARKEGTPVFVYSRKSLLGRFNEIKDAFKEIDPLVCYSMKANSNLSICRLLVKAGAGLDIVSGGELFRAKKIRVSLNKIVYASVGKTDDEIRDALGSGILFFNVESVAELKRINIIAKSLNRKQKVAIRINPDVDAKTHHYITTATKQNKFGIDIKTTNNIFLSYAKKLKNVDICAIHMHIGSQIETVNPFVQAVKKSVALIDDLNSKGACITHLNIGGGLGIIYKDEKPQTAGQYAKAILPILKNKGLKLILEPGRFIAGNSGVLLTKIIYVKDTHVKRFYIIDAAMNDLLRPSFYKAYHEIIPVKKTKGGKKKSADIVGAVCESGDFLAKQRLLPDNLKQNDILAVMSTGAYGFSMSSNYNSRKRAAEVLVNGKKYQLIRIRESYGDLIRNEIVANV